MFLIDLTDLETGKVATYNLENIVRLSSHGEENKNCEIILPSGQLDLVKESREEIMRQVVGTLRPAPQLPPNFKAR